MARLLRLVFLKLLREIFLKACGSKTKQQDSVYLDKKRELISSQVEGLRCGPMVATTLEILVMELNRAMEFIFGLMVHDIVVNGLLTRCLGMALFNGQMAVPLRANLKMELCMGTEFTPGKMEDAMRATTVLTKSTVKGFTRIVTAVSITESGSMDFSMAWVA